VGLNLKRDPQTPEFQHRFWTRVTTNISYLSRATFGNIEVSVEALVKTSNMGVNGAGFMWLPVMRKVRVTPGFKQYVRKIGLVDYWNKFGWPELCRPVGDDDFMCD